MNILIVLNYNDFPTLNTFFTKVNNYSIIDKIVIVDNASTDDSFYNIQRLVELSDKAECIKNSKNGGYGYGNNQGIKYVLKKYPNSNLIISNPDIEVEENTINELIKELNKSDLVMIAPTILEKGDVVPGRKVLTPIKELLLNLPFVYRLKKNDKKENFAFYGQDYYKEKISYVDVVLGCFFIIKSSVMQEIGGYDEEMFLYYEEDVLASKLKFHGYKCAIHNGVTVNHNHSVTINKYYSEFEKEKIKNRSRKYYYRNYQNKKNNVVMNITFVIAYIKKVLKSFIFPKVYVFINFFKKILDNLKVAFRYAWLKYHFFVPPREMYRGIKELKNRIKNIKMSFDEIGKYQKWIECSEKEIYYQNFKYTPFISVIITNHNMQPYYLKECLDSILNQSYKNFEVCISYDSSTNIKSIEILKEYEEMHPQIKVVYRKENGNISAATNSAIEIANGEFIAFMDSDDTLSEDALYYNIEALNKNKSLDLIYSDEDKLDFNGNRIAPYFKYNWNPDLLLETNYIGHFVIVRSSLVKELGGYRSEFVGVQDYDILLRITEKTDRIYHISKILYHLRMDIINITEKSKIIEKKRNVIEAALKRRGLNAELILNNKDLGVYNILYNNDNEKVSILIPTRDHIEYLKPCIESIYEKTTYKNFEVILIDHNSIKNETFRYFEECEKKYNNFKVIRRECEFNYSYLNNEAVKEATGEYLLFLNSDTKLITGNWIEYMLGYARQERIGCVGAKLLYPDNTLQHVGVAFIKEIGTHMFMGFSENKADMEYLCCFSRNCSAVTFACAMVNKKKFYNVNGLNEKLAVDYNDVDFCLEMLESGYENIIVSAVKLYHYESKIRGLVNKTSENYNRWLKAKDYMKNKWRERLSEDKYVSKNFIDYLQNN